MKDNPNPILEIGLINRKLDSLLNNNLSYIPVRYDNFLKDFKNKTLKSGWYLLEDFKSIYDRPDYEDDGGDVVPKNNSDIETIYGNTEPIFIEVLDNKQLSPIAYSELHPDDILHYQLEYNTPINNTPTKGFIYYRENTTNNVKTSFDFRNITFKRYDHSDGKGYFYSWDDGSNDFELFKSFDIDKAFNADLQVCKSLIINFTGFDLSNNVFKDIVSGSGNSLFISTTIENEAENIRNNIFINSNFEEVIYCTNMAIINSFVKKIVQISNFNIVDSNIDTTFFEITGNFKSLNNVIISETDDFRNNRINAQIDNKTITKTAHPFLFDPNVYCEIYSKPNGEIWYKYTNDFNVVIYTQIT